MYVLYVSIWVKARPRTFGCVAMCSAVLFIMSSRVLLYSAGSGVNRVQVVLSGFSEILLCYVMSRQKLYVGMYFLDALVLVTVDVMVMSSAYAMTGTSALGGGKSEV